MEEAIGVLALAAILLVVIVVLAVYSSNRESRFNAELSLVRAERDTERAFRITFVSQETLNGVLKQLAKEAFELFNEETRVMGKAIEEGLDRGVREARLEPIRKSIESAKSKFWDAVSLAKRLGYETPEGIREAALGKESAESASGIRRGN